MTMVNDINVYRNILKKIYNDKDKWKKVRTKLDNVCGKCGPYNVPNKLFQKRTKRSSRCLISWKTVLQNKLTLDQLNTFYNGVTVEMINQDFFLKKTGKTLFLENF